MNEALKHTLLKGIVFGGLLIVSGNVSAVVLNLTAEFKADISKPENNKFTNTTPISGFCATRPQYCLGGEFSIISGLTARKTLVAGSSDIQNDHMWFQLDGRKKTMILTNVTNGHSISVDFRLASYGARLERESASDGNLSNAMSGLGPNPSGGCSGRTGWGGAASY